MSGGHFNYQQYRLHDIAEEILELIASNNSQHKNSWGETVGREYKPETIAEFERAVHALNVAAVYAQRVDPNGATSPGVQPGVERSSRNDARLAGGIPVL